MSHSDSRTGRRFIVTLGVLLIAALALPAHAEFDVRKSIDADRLIIHNLIGEISVEGARGSEFEVEIRARGRDADEETLQVEIDEGSTTRLSVLFPIDEEKQYVYPELGSSKTTFDYDRGEKGGWFSKMLGGASGRRIKVSGRGSGLEVWADITVRVPDGRDLEIRHGVGKLSADGVDSKLILATRSGSVDVTDVTGSLLVDVGSGKVTVDGATGDKVVIDTGSGSVELNNCESDKINVDTGSGRVRIDTAAGSDIRVDTGSGSVRAIGVEVDSLNIDTGSGAVTLELDRMGSGDFVIDTGSGGIELHLPADASAEIRADSGSGGIDLDLAGGAEIRRHDRDSAVAYVGSGDASVELDTGSGSIRVYQ